MIGRGHRGRVDANQPAIVEALRKAGAVVQSLSRIGEGCPDLLVGYRGRTILMEVKDDSQPPSKRLLTEDELKWQGRWCGSVVRNVGSVEAALRALMDYP
jgi:hypothetical protein